LLKLKMPIPENYEVFYNGWDISGNVPQSGVSIHHPEGDYKKISTYDSPAKDAKWKSPEGIGADNAHWNVIFSSGVTEGGSSGAPLFDQNKRIAGTLTGGNSSCSNKRGDNLYGKMSYHWDEVDTAQMKTYLDPINKAVLILDGRYHDPLFIEFTADRTNIVKEESVSFSNGSYGYDNVVWSFPGGNPSTSTQTNPIVKYSEPGMYDVTLTIYSNNQEKTKTFPKYIAVKEEEGQIIPGSLIGSIDKINNAIKLEWKIQETRLYKQELSSNSNEAADYIIRWDAGQPIFRDRRSENRYTILSSWTPEDLNIYQSIKLKSLLISLVDTTSTYTLKIYEDKNPIYSQPLPLNNKIEHNAQIDLTGPLLINPQKNLLFGYEVNQKDETEMPIAIGSGPILPGKNILLTDNRFISAESAGYKENWNLGAIIEAQLKKTYSFKVFRNDREIASHLTETSFADYNLPFEEDNLCYKVVTVYDDRESYPTDPICFSNPLTSIDEIGYTDIILSPNPTVNEFSIESKNPIKEIIISSINGQIIYKTETNNETSFSIRTDLWNNGIYIVKVITDKSIVNRKIIKFSN